MGGPPRAPPEDDVKTKLTSLIVRIGDKSTSALESNIDGLLPYKTPIYATIVGKINLKNFEFGKEIICTLVDEITDALAKQRYHSARLLLRFITGLVNTNVLPPMAMFETFETLLSVLSVDGYSQTKADYYVYLVLTTLPWTFTYPTFTRPVFRIFDDQSDGELKPIDRHVIEEYIVDILFFFNANHKDAAKFIYSLPVKGEIDHIVVETILAEAFRLPHSAFKPIYYSVMFVDLFKEQHATIIPVFAYAITTLYDNLDHLDQEVVDRFSLMFAHHLSNFEYKWVWSDWATSLSPDTEVTLLVRLQRRFITQLLESIVRLCYLDKIKTILPVEYHPYLPTAPQPSFKFLPTPGSMEEEPKEMVTQSHKLLLLFKTKEPLDTIIEHVTAIPQGENSRVNVVELVTKCILHIGSTSFSHLSYAIERYVTLFKTIIKSNEDRAQCLLSATTFWASSHQHVAIVVDKLITYKILQPIDPIAWLISPDTSLNVTDYYIWEIIYNCIEKTNIIIDTLKSDYDQSMNSTEKELKYKSAQQEQQQLFSALFRGLSILMKNPQIDPTDLKILSGHLKAITRRYFSQVKALLEEQPALLTIVNEYTQ
eukprot:gene11019-12844_t